MTLNILPLSMNIYLSTLKILQSLQSCTKHIQRITPDDITKKTKKDNIIGTHSNEKQVSNITL